MNGLEKESPFCSCSSSAGLFARPYARPASTAQRRDSGPSPGLRPLPRPVAMRAAIESGREWRPVPTFRFANSM
jgi:hypothetical protein